ncbi:flagellar hook-associated protein FlgL [soil metagenome]
MRLSTNTMFEAGSARLSDLQSALQKTQQQLSSNRRILTPSDDPVASAQALQISQAQAVNAQYAINRQSAKDSLGQVENALAGSDLVLQQARTLAVTAGNVASLTQSDRDSLANQLSDHLNQLLTYANAEDGRGTYLFSGYQTPVEPFTKTPTGAQYNGDQGNRMSQIGSGRQVAMSDPGDSVFNTIKTMVTSLGPANVGSASVSPGAVTDATLLTGHTYSVDITGTGNTFAVYDLHIDPTKVGVPLMTGVYPTTGPIRFDGVQVDITGPAVTGDTFIATPLNNQSVFKTMQDFVTALRTPSNTALSNSVATVLGNIDQAFNQIQTVRSSVGSRLAEVDVLDAAGLDKDLQYSTSLSALQDLDYAKAISEFTQQQTTLQAAQKTFLSLSDLSLFKLL